MKSFGAGCPHRPHLEAPRHRASKTRACTRQTALCGGRDKPCFRGAIGHGLDSVAPPGLSSRIGQPVGVITVDQRLVISERALDVLKGLQLNDALIEPFEK
jgi:hypothetical protein